jgi:methionyl-tRNA formyltransferase
MGTPDFAVPSLKGLAGDGFAIAGVVTQPDRPRGRGKKLAPSPVKEAAAVLGLKVFQPRRVREAEFVSVLEGLRPDVIAVVAFGQILPAAVLSIPSLGCVNVHASLLPEYRGAAPMQRAVMDGKERTGITIMRMNQGLDSGDILLQSAIKIGADESFGSVHDRLAGLGAGLLAEALKLLGAGKLAGIPQDHQRATYAPMITRQDEIIDWQRGAGDIKNRIRGLNPRPGARTFLGDRVLKIWAASVARDHDLSGSAGAVPGQVLDSAGGGLAVRCGDGAVVIEQLQLQGGKKLGAGEFLRGCRIAPGTVLGRV